MEHRWGRRISCTAPVRVTLENGLIGSGRLRNASSSGAFIETTLATPMLSRVSIAITRDDRTQREIRAIVVRRDPDGIAIEWCKTEEGSICSGLGCETRCAASNPPH